MTDDAAELSDPDPDVDVSHADLDDDELGRVLEALLLVVDAPVGAETLATVIEQPVYRITAKLEVMAAIWRPATAVSICAKSAAAGGCTPGPASRRM